MSTLATPVAPRRSAGPLVAPQEQSVLAFTLTLLAWAVVAILVALLAALVIVPRIMGWIPLTVLSGSMEPTYPVGSQVVVQRVAADPAGRRGVISTDELRVGQVISYLPDPANPRIVTHRIIRIDAMADGSRAFITQGDNNNVADARPVLPKQVRGLVKYHVPYAGFATNSLTSQQKGTGSILAAAAFFLYAGWQLVGLVRGSGRRPTGSRVAP